MNDDIIKEVQDVIKKYIDDVGDKKIAERTLDKISDIYKQLLSDINIKIKPILKKDTNLKNEVAELKKKKTLKGASKNDKAVLTKEFIDKFISLFKQQNSLDDVIELYNEKMKEVKRIKSWNKYEQWIGWALDFAEGSYLATHIAKLTHSSSKGSSIDVRYHKSCKKYNSKYLVTADKPLMDTAYPDNKYSSISQLYDIAVKGQYIGDLLRENGEKYLQPFTRNSYLLEYWVDRFSTLIKNEQKQSYFLSKQIYFPTHNEQYHLLLPLTSSSLVHAIYLKHKLFFDDEQQKARDQKKHKKYSPTTICSFPNKAYLHVTGSNHSNASSLNGKRGGRIALLPAMPPQWESSFTSPINRSSIFDKTLSYKLKNEITELQKYLLLIKNKSLSISEPKRNAAVLKKLNAITDHFFDYIELINAQEAEASWTCDSKLPIEEQLLFEPWRTDEDAKAIQLNNQWQKTISKAFGRWLNRQLKKKKKLVLTPVHATLWADAFLSELHKIIATQEVVL